MRQFEMHPFHSQFGIFFKKCYKISYPKANQVFIHIVYCLILSRLYFSYIEGKESIILCTV